MLLDRNQGVVYCIRQGSLSERTLPILSLIRLPLTGLENYLNSSLSFGQDIL